MSSVDQQQQSPTVSAIELNHSNESSSIHSISDLDSINPWNSEISDAECEKELAARSLARLENEHLKAGYRHGITLGKNQTIQKGFDDGYSMGSSLGIRVGNLVGKLRSTLLAMHLLADHTRYQDQLEDGNTLLERAKSIMGSASTVFTPTLTDTLNESRTRTISPVCLGDEKEHEWRSIEREIACYCDSALLMIKNDLVPQ